MKLNTLLCICISCILLLVTALIAEEIDKTSILSEYNGTENNIIKRKVLRKLSLDTEVKGSAVAQWKKDLLQEALQEKNPTVVEAAVQQIGKLNLKEFNNILISLYHKASDIYANMYDNRVKINIVKAFGKTGAGDNNVVNLFQYILDIENNKFTYVQGDVLQSINELNDLKYLSMVEKYGKFMEGAIAKKKAAGEDPMLYQVLKDYSSMCDNIVKTLKK